MRVNSNSIGIISKPKVQSFSIISTSITKNISLFSISLLSLANVSKEPPVRSPILLESESEKFSTSTW
ncbi:hypothetical protein BpHYR1_052265 [Brachionus plicatilis]|uniref:Uncharacterized protein n=1 Tax=Brachionus plicatilis TaxID=10195 RepID=A0A3M7TA61_BRAPC|nr:hypothetical protein BpHYR1_052265 [Brachionus plicatilis]